MEAEKQMEYLDLKKKKNEKKTHDVKRRQRVKHMRAFIVMNQVPNCQSL